MVALGCSTSKEGETPLNLTINNPQEGLQITFLALTDEGMKRMDSVILDNQEKVTFYFENKEPNFYRLEVAGSQVINLILDGNEPSIDLTMDGQKPGMVLIEGSVAANHMLKLDSTARKLNSDTRMLNQEAMRARGSGDFNTLQEISDQYNYLARKHNKNLKSLIRGAHPTLSALYGLEYLDFERDFIFIDSVTSLYRNDFSEHPLASSFIDRVDAMRKLAIGAEAPDIKLPTPDGDMLSLSSLRGNYVLVDFWAAWCRPCRAENPNVVRMYNEYKDKNFEILGVSLDRDRTAWLKAIEDDGLTWKHVSDLQYFNSEAARIYQINAIPATYLIGPDGTILDKNLRGPSLEAKLKEIFG
jgi:peroxiredoxin